MRPLEVVVVAYGGAEDLKRALESIGDGWPIHVVDNSSSADVEQVARGCGAGYLDTGGNLGFSAGVNAGLRLVGSGADVLLLNPDAAIEPQDVDRLRAVAASSPDVGAVAPRLMGFDGTPQRVMWPFPSPCRMWLEALFRFSPRSAAGFVVGAVLLLTRPALDAVGGFDERFFLYFEETDWQRRALDAGFTSLTVDHATARHTGAGTSTDSRLREARFHAGVETYIRKWSRAPGWVSYRAAAFLGAALRAVLTNKTGRQVARLRMSIYARGPVATADRLSRP